MRNLGVSEDIVILVYLEVKNGSETINNKTVDFYLPQRDNSNQWVEAEVPIYILLLAIYFFSSPLLSNTYILGSFAQINCLHALNVPKSSTLS